MVSMALCDACGLETDLDKSARCSNCGAVVNLDSAPEQEKIVSPAWGVLKISVENLGAIEKQEFVSLFQDVWSRVELSLLSTLLPSQGNLILLARDRIELLCHSTAAYRVEKEVEALGPNYRAGIEFIEISEAELKERLRALRS